VSVACQTIASSVNAVSPEGGAGEFHLEGVPERALGSAESARRIPGLAGAAGRLTPVTSTPRSPH